MRLINTETGKFEEFLDSSTAPLYAILSHTWEQPPGREQSFQDVMKIQEKCGLLDEETSSNTDPNKARPTSQILEVDSNTSELHTSTQLPQADQQLPQISSSIFALFKPLFVAILARASLYLLLGSLIPPFPNPQREVEPAPTPSHPSIWDSGSGLSEKIRNACRVAREDGFRYIWIDSSCIDKTSSSELSEAINSMFNWYRDAQICYAFLSDVPSNDEVRAKGLDLPESSRPRPVNRGRHAQLRPNGDTWRDEIDSVMAWVSFNHKVRTERAKDSKFRNSRWFKRSWTLQELIAPRVVIFLSQEWRGLGTKHSLADLIEEITHIDRNILTHMRAVADESVAERMRWAASREATRVEDEAYSLLGIFGITMTTVYGEGRRAFQRLQEEILQRIPDRSLFAWCDCTNQRPIHISQATDSETRVSGPTTSPFATSPKSFANEGGKIDALSEQDLERLQLPVEEYTLTPHGIRAEMRLIAMQCLAPKFRIAYYLRDHEPRQYSSFVESWYLTILASQRAHSIDENPTYFLGKLCRISPAKYGTQLLEVTSADSSSTLIWIDCDLDIRSLLEESLHVYLPRPTPSISKRQPAEVSSNISQVTTISLSSWAPSALPRGYAISESSLHLNEERLCLQPLDHPSLSLLFSNNKSVNLLIEYRHIHYTEKQFSTIRSYWFIEARLWILSSNALFDSRSPYASAVWGAGEGESTLPIWYIAVPVTQSEETMWIHLRFWLGISKYNHYNVHVEAVKDCPGVTKEDYYRPYVEIVSDAGQYTHINIAVNSNYAASSYYQQYTRQQLVSPYNDAPLQIPEPHPDFKFTMLGSTKRELEAQGYSVHLEASGENSGNSHSHIHSLTISDSDVNPTFTISIKYFHNRCTRPGEEFPQFIFAASITLESAPLHGSESYQDGPYVLNWADHYKWSPLYGAQSPIYLTTPIGDVLALDLSLDRAWVSEYYLVVHLTRNADFYSQTRSSDDHPRELQFRLVDPHEQISLTLPTQTRRALQVHGYEVRFEGSKNHPYYLTLSDTNLAINIEYTHHRPTGSDGRQGLEFQACITTSVLNIPLDAAAQCVSQTVNWDTWQHESRNLFGFLERKGWSWKLSNEDIKLALPDGLELTLRLGFHLVWLSEYCITVEVVPPTSPWSPRKTIPSKNGEVNGGVDVVGTQETSRGESHGGPGEFPLPLPTITTSVEVEGNGW